MSERVLVYGSLRKGMGNHVLLQDAEYVGDTTVANFAMVSLGAFPALVPVGTAYDKPIVCEEYIVTEAQFQALDRLEGYPGFYDRCMVDSSSGHPCWIYFIEDRELLSRPLVKEGDWCKYKGAA